MSAGWGFDRGTPIDRYYIDQFLAGHRSDIGGRVLEVADTRYTDRFGTGVDHSEVLDLATDNPQATLVADLGIPGSLPERSYDCFVLTQTLQYVFDLRAAVENVRAALRPGGVALVTLPSVSRVAASAGLGGDFWRLTAGSCERLFGTGFADVEVRSYGNVLTCAAFLYGFAAEELKPDELEHHDPYFPLLIAVRAAVAHTN